MGVFGNLFGKEEPASRDKAGFKDGPSFVGGVLLYQFFPGNRPLLTDQKIATLTHEFDPKLRKLVELWLVIYVTWLLRLLAKSKFDEDYARSMMAEVYGRIGTNEDRLPGIADLAQGIKYWFRELDEGVQHAIKNPMKVGGVDLPVVYMLAIRFLARDADSPFRGNPNPDFHDMDISLAGALEQAQNFSKPRIDYTLDAAAKMAR
jgi:hypothetical protein